MLWVHWLLSKAGSKKLSVRIREDLGLAGELPRACIHPDNIRSLKGLDECLQLRGVGDTGEAVQIRQRLELAAARSDLPVGASRHCAQAAMKAAAAG